LNKEWISFLLTPPPDEPVDLAHCFECGQIFRWRAVADAWVGTFRGTALVLHASTGRIAVEAVGDSITPGAVARFLGLEDRLAEIVPRIDTDPVMHACLEALPGLRLLRQDPWECLIAYVSSSWNNIPKIQRSLGQIARRWGRHHRVRVGAEIVEVDCFPSPTELAAASEAELRECGLGYRAPYVRAAAARMAQGELDLGALRGASYMEALAALLRLPGVGRKVADCILLFSLEKGAAFPVDVWVRRVIHEYYREGRRGAPPRHTQRVPGTRWSGGGGHRAQRGPAEGRNQTLGEREYGAIQRFAWERWGAWAGYAQQYLFYGKRLGII
jgi:N-glycosylase/DNA lyase